MLGVWSLPHCGCEVARLIRHNFALCRVMGILVPMCVAVELAAGCRDGLGRFGFACSLLSFTSAFVVSRPLLTFLQVLVFVLQDCIRTLQLCQGHIGGTSCWCDSVVLSRSRQKGSSCGGFGSYAGCCPNVGQVPNDVCGNSRVGDRQWIRKILIKVR